MRKVLIVVMGLLLVAGGGSAAFLYWKAHVKKKQYFLSLEYAREYLTEGHAGDALHLIDTYRGRRADYPGTENQWQSLEVKASAMSRDLPRLDFLYSQNPMQVVVNEDASLLMARMLLHRNKWDECAGIISYWRNTSPNPHFWFSLEADRHILQGDPASARDLLESRQFPGREDSGRLMRLAMLRAGDDLAGAWELLDEAQNRDPDNPDVHTFKAQILEKSGDRPRARAEYALAWAADPQNVFLGDQLAEFYIRQNQYPMALAVWARLQETGPLPSIAFKSHFWAGLTSSSTTASTVVSWPQGEVVDSAMQVIRAIQQIPAGSFWDSNIDREYPEYRRDFNSNDMIGWLKVLQTIADGDMHALNSALEGEAMKRNSLEREMRFLLSAIAAFRLNVWHPSLLVEARWFGGADGEEHHIATRSLARMVMDRNILREDHFENQYDAMEWLHGPCAFPVVLASRGWFGAAWTLLKKRGETSLHDGLPSWAAYTLVSGIRRDRGAAQALQWLPGKSDSPELSLLKAEMLLESGELNGAMSIFGGLVRRDDGAGRRAAWILGTLYLERNQLQDAEKLIAACPGFTETPRGVELRARICLARDREDEALELYRSVASESSEAQAYLLRHYRKLGNEAEARDFARQLYLSMPDETRIWKEL